MCFKALSNTHHLCGERDMSRGGKAEERDHKPDLMVSSASRPLLGHLHSSPQCLGYAESRASTGT